MNTVEPSDFDKALLGGCHFSKVQLHLLKCTPVYTCNDLKKRLCIEMLNAQCPNGKHSIKVYILTTVFGVLTLCFLYNIGRSDFDRGQ